MGNKTIDREDLRRLGERLINENEPGDFGLTEKARECMSYEEGKEPDTLSLYVKFLAGAYCEGYALGYMRGKDLRVVTAEVIEK